MHDTAPHEAWLIEQVQQHRDPTAFRELYRTYFPRIAGYVAYRVAHRHDREDVVSEIFLKALDYLPRFEYRGKGSFSAWLFRIAHNTVSSYHTDNTPHASEGDENPLLEHLSSTSEAFLPPEQIITRHEAFAQLHQHLRALPPQRQKVITLRFFGDLSNQEIAEILNLDARTVASHLSRGLADLYRLYQRAAQQDAYQFPSQIINEERIVP